MSVMRSTHRDEEIVKFLSERFFILTFSFSEFFEVWANGGLKIICLLSNTVLNYRL